MPVLPMLSDLFPDSGLRRGSVVAVTGPGATLLSLAVAAGPSAAGTWTAVVGDPAMGLAAAAEAGVALERLLVVDPGDSDSWATAMAALVGAVDVVVVGPGHRRAGATRRISSRLRERGSVVVAIGGWYAVSGTALGSSAVEAVEGAPVERGSLRISVVERGNLKAAQSIDLTSEVEGRSTILSLIDEGVAVEPGDVLCQLDTSQLKDEIVQQEISVQNTEAAKTTGLVSRLMAERERPQADVFWSSEIARTLWLQEQGVLTSYVSPNAASTS